MQALSGGEHPLGLLLKEVGTDYPQGHHHHTQVDNVAAVASSVAPHQAGQGDKGVFAMLHPRPNTLAKFPQGGQPDEGNQPVAK